MITCPRCKTIEPDGTKICTNCGYRLSSSAENTVICPKCHTAHNFSFCPNCGEKAPNKNADSLCPNCGTIHSCNFCPNCGAPATNNIRSSNPSPVSYGPIKNGYTAALEMERKAEKRSIKRYVLVVVIVLLLAVFFSILLSNTSDSSGSAQSTKFISSDFKSLYKNCCSPTYATLGADGSYLSIDTNPDDLDDYSDDDAVQAIVDINYLLGLPDYLLDDMGKTTALMGRQTETFEKVTVSWSYHPNRGLEVTYKKNK